MNDSQVLPVVVYVDGAWRTWDDLRERYPDEWLRFRHETATPHVPQPPRYLLPGQAQMTVGMLREVLDRWLKHGSPDDLVWLSDELDQDETARVVDVAHRDEPTRRVVLVMEQRLLSR